mgnify:CR=1 FL=1
MPRSVSHVRPRRANAIVMLISSTKNDLTGGSALGSSAGGGRKQLFGASLCIHLTHERFRDTCHSGRFFAVFSCFISRNRCGELNLFWVAKHPIDLKRVHCSGGMAGSQGRSVKADGDPISEPIVLKFGMNLIMGGDHLRCVTEEFARDDLAARTTSDAFEEAGLRIGRHEIAWSWWLIGGIALVGAALIGFEWLFSRVCLCSLRLQPFSGKRRCGRSPP